MSRWQWWWRQWCWSILWCDVNDDGDNDDSGLNKAPDTHIASLKGLHDAISDPDKDLNGLIKAYEVLKVLKVLNGLDDDDDDDVDKDDAGDDDVDNDVVDDDEQALAAE